MKSKLVISDRRYRVWKDSCYHEYANGKECGKLCDEDTGECPRGHGRSQHGCHTSCCAILVAGNHKYCRYHRKEKLRSICKIQDKIMAEFRKRMWGKHNERYDMERGSAGRKEFEDWSEKQLKRSYDKEILLIEKIEAENKKIE